MKTNQIAVTALLAIYLACFSGCAWYAAHKTSIYKTAEVVGARVASIAGSVVMSATASYLKAEQGADYSDGLASAFRSYQGSLITSGDIEAITKAWTPNEQKWTEAAKQFAAQWDEVKPKDSKESAIFLEAFAKGLNAAAEVTRSRLSADAP